MFAATEYAALRSCDKLEAFVRRKGLNRQFMQPDEEVIGPLPGYQGMMSKIQHAFRTLQHAYLPPT